MMVSQNRAHQVAVETGIRQGDRVQITKGLAGGESVIVNGGYALPDNTQVKIASAQSTGQPGAGGEKGKD
jgi:multidrug efflux pump subunit AcrA (membrane-fusion protein)